ncbi:hypothetical protein Pan216_12910 [Planctomycetes bacterium Pan216]|uniref:Uncharacterized protein n=2 Tax=Kolteria novifilia TaxID=2527975 RepID=A0A518B0F2_9BACT|nr:hypothetical protein Pan216_12910 [Planctomycetes bacterium Pan216]
MSWRIKIVPKEHPPTGTMSSLWGYVSRCDPRSWSNNNKHEVITTWTDKDISQDPRYATAEFSVEPTDAKDRRGKTAAIESLKKAIKDLDCVETFDITEEA